MANKNIMIVPCMVNSWLYSSACTMFCSGSANCVRISMAKMPPIRKNTPPVIINRRPTLVWLTAASAPQPGRFAQTFSNSSRSALPSLRWLVLIGVLLLLGLTPPPIKVLRRVCVYHKFHMSMSGTTELRALSSVRAGLVRLYAQHVGMAGDHIELARQAWHPKRMNHIRAAQMHIDSVARRNVHNIHQADVRIGIVHLPPPLVTGDMNMKHLAFFRRQRQHPVPSRNSENQQQPSTDNRQNDRSEEHTSELQSRGHLVCRLLLEKKKQD